MNTYIIIGLAVGLVVVLFIIRIVFRKEKAYDWGRHQRINSTINKELITGKVKEYLSSGKKIDAIKFVHDNSKTGLAEAKKIVEDIESDNTITRSFQSQNTPNQNVSNDNHLTKKINQLIKNGNKIAAVKLIRENFMIGLKEAKDFVDAVEKGMNLS